MAARIIPSRNGSPHLAGWRRGLEAFEVPGRRRPLSAQFQPSRLAAVPRHPRPRPLASHRHAIVASNWRGVEPSRATASRCRGGPRRRSDRFDGRPGPAHGGPPPPKGGRRGGDPRSGGAVHAGGQEAAALGLEGDRAHVDPVAMEEGGRERLAGDRIPDPCGAVQAARRQPAAIRAEGRHQHLMLMGQGTRRGARRSRRPRPGPCGPRWPWRSAARRGCRPPTRLRRHARAEGRADGRLTGPTAAPDIAAKLESEQAVRRTRPSGRNATQLTGAPDSSGGTRAGRWRHPRRRAVPSAEAVASRRPSALKARASTSGPCSSGGRAVCPVVTSQIRAGRRPRPWPGGCRRG